MEKIEDSTVVEGGVRCKYYINQEVQFEMKSS